MAIKMKGLLKGLRYISQIFDTKEEQEMQIGYPTDVKHVAHIGWEGNSVNSPSWMNEFRTARLPQDLNRNTDSPTRGEASRRNASPADPPSRASRPSRRHQSAGNVSIGSPGGEPGEGSSRHGRRPKSASSATANGEGASDSPLGDLPAIPRQSRRKKNKDSTSGGSSSRSSRSKAAHASFSDPVADNERTAERLPALPSLKLAREEQVF